MGGKMIAAVPLRLVRNLIREKDWLASEGFLKTLAGWVRLNWLAKSSSCSRQGFI